MEDALLHKTTHARIENTFYREHILSGHIVWDDKDMRLGQNNNELIISTNVSRSLAGSVG